MGAPTYSLRYGSIYFAGQGAKSLLAVGVVVQLWLLALQDYPALARFGRRIVVYLLLAALLVGSAGLLLEPSRSPNQNPFPHYFNSIEGTVDSMTVLFLIAAALFLLWFPVETPRNTACLMGGFAFYSTEHWAALLLLNQYPLHTSTISAAMQSLDFICLIFWILTLKKSGETGTTVTGHRWNQEDAEHLLRQLKEMNARLERASRPKH